LDKNEKREKGKSETGRCRPCPQKRKGKGGGKPAPQNAELGRRKRGGASFILRGEKRRDPPAPGEQALKGKKREDETFGAGMRKLRAREEGGRKEGERNEGTLGVLNINE